MADKRYFEFEDASSHKFWEIWVEGNEVRTRYGKIGASGQTTVKDEGSPAGAQKLYDKLLHEKTGKGYVEKTAGVSSAAAPATPAAKPASKPAAKPAPKKAAAEDEDDEDEDEDDEDSHEGDEEDEEEATARVPSAGARMFEFDEGGGDGKFWEIRVEGKSHTVRFGKTGTDGQTRTKSFADAAAAQKDADKLIAEKTKKGYEEAGE
jgi:predicted DNA-binding WGR domain protein